jgi:hypothetical protein
MTRHAFKPYDVPLLIWPYLRSVTCERCLSEYFTHLAVCEMECDAVLRFRSFVALVRVWATADGLFRMGKITVCGTIIYVDFISCVAVCCKFFYLTATGRTETSLTNPLGKSAIRSSTTGAWEHGRCLGILVYLLISLVCWLFLLRSNKPQFWALLTSNLGVNYHSTTQNYCISTPSLSSPTPPTPSPVVLVGQRNSFYVSLADQFKILGI